MTEERIAVPRRPRTAEELSQSELPVIIFGAGVVGEVLLHVCRRAGVHVECFCDNSYSKVGIDIHGTPVIHASELRAKYQDAIFLIAFADIQDIVEQLGEYRYDKWETCELLEGAPLPQLELNASPDFVAFVVQTCLLCHKNYMHPEMLFLHSVDVIVTERCSLRCQDCSNLMQYFSRPRDYDIQKVIRSIQALCAAVDQINDFRVIGGEPLMHREVHRLVEDAAVSPKVKGVAIYTNGTILPRPEQIEAFRQDKVLFIVTDYRALSRKLSALEEMLKQEEIAYFIHRPSGWTSCSRISRHDRTPEQQHEIFRACCARNLFPVSDGRIYRCPFIANATRLGAIPDCPTDSVDLLAEVSPGELRARLREFAARTDFMMGCDYCDGRPWDDPQIQPAIQVRRPLSYEPMPD